MDGNQKTKSSLEQPDSLEEKQNPEKGSLLEKKEEITNQEADLEKQNQQILHELSEKKKTIDQILGNKQKILIDTLKDIEKEEIYKQEITEKEFQLTINEIKDKINIKDISNINILFAKLSKWKQQKRPIWSHEIEWKYQAELEEIEKKQDKLRKGLWPLVNYYWMKKLNEDKKVVEKNKNEELEKTAELEKQYYELQTQITTLKNEKDALVHEKIDNFLDEIIDQYSQLKDMACDEKNNQLLAQTFIQKTILPYLQKKGIIQEGIPLPEYIEEYISAVEFLVTCKGDEANITLSLNQNREKISKIQNIYKQELFPIYNLSRQFRGKGNQLFENSIELILKEIAKRKIDDFRNSLSSVSKNEKIDNQIEKKLSTSTGYDSWKKYLDLEKIPSSEILQYLETPETWSSVKEYLYKSNILDKKTEENIDIILANKLVKSIDHQNRDILNIMKYHNNLQSLPLLLRDLNHLKEDYFGIKNLISTLDCLIQNNSKEEVMEVIKELSSEQQDFIINIWAEKNSYFCKYALQKNKSLYNIYYNDAIASIENPTLPIIQEKYTKFLEESGEKDEKKIENFYLLQDIDKFNSENIDNFVGDLQTIAEAKNIPLVNIFKEYYPIILTHIEDANIHSARLIDIWSKNMQIDPKIIYEQAKPQLQKFYSGNLTDLLKFFIELERITMLDRNDEFTEFVINQAKSKKLDKFADVERFFNQLKLYDDSRVSDEKREYSIDSVLEKVLYNPKLINISECDEFVSNLDLFTLLYECPRIKLLLEDKEKIGPLKDNLIANIKSKLREAYLQKDPEVKKKLKSNLERFVNLMIASNVPMNVIRLEFAKLTEKSIIDTCKEEFEYDGKKVEFCKLPREKQFEVFNQDLIKNFLYSQTSSFKRFLYRDLSHLSSQQKKQYGIENFDLDELNYYHNYFRSKSNLNQQRYEQYLTNPELILDYQEGKVNGDLLHGSNIQYFDEIINYGLLPGDFLGPNTDKGDCTPFDPDFSSIGPNDKGDFSCLNNKTAKSPTFLKGVMFIFDHNRDHKDDAFKYEFDLVNTKHDHVHTRTGMPICFCKAILIDPTSSTYPLGETLNKIKKSLAKKGFFIPIASLHDGRMTDDQGKPYFSPEEFDEMRNFYQDLNKMGYPVEVIDNVYNYYLSNQAVPEGSRFNKTNKHKAVMQKAIEYNKNLFFDEQYENFDKKIDLVVLVDFLKNNELNTHGEEWYESSDINKIMHSIQSVTEEKIGTKTDRQIYGDFEVKEVEVNGQKFLSQFNRINKDYNQYWKRSQTQMNYLFDHAGNQKSLKNLKIFADKYNEALATVVGFCVPLTKNKTESIAEAMQTIAEQKTKLMASIWRDVLSEISPAELPESFRECVVPTVSGSIGRDEVTLSSDCDYLIIVDDDKIDKDKREEIINSYKIFIKNTLSQKINDKLKTLGIRPDAGLARADSNPFVLKSAIKDFVINLDLQKSGNKQSEEPTEIVDCHPLFKKDMDIINQCKSSMIIDNQTASNLDEYIINDLVMPKKKLNYTSRIQMFKSLYNNLAGGNTLEQVKESMQRVINFKIYYLLFASFNKGKIDQKYTSEIPASTIEKIDFLYKHSVLSKEDASAMKELTTMSFKLRFLGDLFSAEAHDASDTKKVDNARFVVEDLDYNERARLFKLLKYFDKNILEKYIIEDL